MQRLTFIVSMLLLIAPAVRADTARQIMIVNGTHFAIFAVQAKPSGTTAWQPDILSQNTLGIGKMRGVTLPVDFSCTCDFLATLDDGHKVLIPKADICRHQSLAVIDDRH